ncbi:MAG: hypothetical protein E6Q37_00645 [Crocinitomicaceae bacterium]|nr:MAG: hypothetical protein E6Q37_00645 [Crocinitomicaceae bacterium]
MKYVKTWLLVLWSIIAQNIHAQTDPSFPVVGQFSVTNSSETTIYDQVIISQNTFTILKNGVVLKQFRIVEETTEGFKIEQYFSENDYPKRDRQRFTIKIDNFNTNEYYVTLYFTSKTENIHLYKNQ